MSNSPIAQVVPTWLTLVTFVVSLAAIGITGQWDYEAERTFECARKNLHYNPRLDACVPQVPRQRFNHPITT